MQLLIEDSEQLVRRRPIARVRRANEVADRRAQGFDLEKGSALLPNEAPKRTYSGTLNASKQGTGELLITSRKNRSLRVL